MGLISACFPFTGGFKGTHDRKRLLKPFFLSPAGQEFTQLSGGSQVQ